jgi:polyhydroxybutyrate depolymerase
MQVAGQQRTYILASPQASGPLPTVVFLHGKGGSATKERRIGFEQLGDRERFVTVYPNGLGGAWNVFPSGFHDRNGASTSGADTAFIEQLVADLVQRGIADPNRVYLSGVSNGGLMALRLACDAPELFAAIGVLLASMPDYAARGCHPSKPIPLLMVNGTADPIMPYGGGKTAAGLKVWGTERTITFFRELNGCAMAPKRSEIAQSDWRGTRPIVVDRWTGCSGAPIVLYSVVGGGHRAPGGPGMGEGFSTAQTLWDFFHDKSAGHN